ncbi:immunoglobulin domain-containing protein, partial [Flavobacterium weaverense]
MNNLYSRTKNFKLLYFLFIIVVFIGNSFTTDAQICGTPGVDGPANISTAINTYYPIQVGEPTLNAGAQAVNLGAVPAIDAYENNFGTTPISVGDLILIIQMQDADINYSNSQLYGSGISNSFKDRLGGTGFTNIGNTGVFEYVIATNNVPLIGGNLTFKGAASNGGVKNSYYNAEATSARGKRTFQIIRLPQYSNLILTSDITTPPFNGSAGGIIAFSVSGNFDFNGKKIDGNARGFRGGYSPVGASLVNNSTTYVGNASNKSISGKGEGIAGTPRFMYDGYNQVDNLVEGMPGGSAGRGAPANAGGGGNDHNAGGGGGGNGGYGGLGGIGWQGAKGDTSTLNGGGRPGFRSYLTTNPLLNTLVMGGGGGAGDANDATNGVKGGVGGAIILINAGTISGTGSISANGGNGAAGVYANNPDGAGGGGAGGSVLLNIANSSTAKISIEAKGGNGGNTFLDSKNEHGPGGGGGGGIIRYNAIGATIYADVTEGFAGKTNNGGSNTILHGAVNGTDGYIATFNSTELNPELQITSNCLPILETNVESLIKSLCNTIGNEIIYKIEIKNTGNGNAAGVVLDFEFPSGMEFTSATASYSVGASGPSGPLTNTSTSINPLFGGFNIALNGIVTITLKGKLTATASSGVKSAMAQALYLDPTRTIVNPNRKITAFTNSYGSAIKTYESSNASDVPGTNFNGVPANITIDDITIWALPGVPTTSVTQPTCSTLTGEIKVLSPANGTGVTYTIIGVNPVVAAKTNATGIFSGLVAGSYSITTANLNLCSSLPTDNIIINGVAGAPTTTGASICVGGSGSLVATGCSNNSNIKWYTEPTGGTAIFTGTPFNPIGVSNSGITNTDTPSSTTFYAECSDGGCRAATNFVINPIPTINSTTAGTSCGTGTVSLNATASTGTINWYDASTGGTLVGTGTNFVTPSLTQSKTYYVEVTDNGCTSSRLPVVATINEIPTITSKTPNERCGPGTVELKATASAGNVNWYSDAQGGVLLATGNTYTPNISQTTTYYVDATNNGCTSTSRIAVAATIKAAPIAPTSTNQTVCTDGTATQTLTATATGGTITWYTDATGGTVVNTPTQVGVGSKTYYSQASNGTCSSLRTPVVLTISPAITFTATATNVSCNGAADGTITVSGVSAGATTTIKLNNTGADLSAQTKFGPGTYTITATNGSCVTSKNVTITEPVIVTVTATATNVSCNGATDGTIIVSGVSAGATTTIKLNNAGADLSAQTKFAPGTYTITATNGSCVTSKNVTITEPILVTVTATATNVSCNGAADGT